MKLRTISEMPLAGYHVNDTVTKSRGHQFSNQSDNLLRKPKVLDQLTKVLSRTGYKIIIIADAEAPIINGEKLPDEYYVSAGINPSIASDAITILISFDNSGDQHHLTPWIILHQLGEVATKGGAIGPWNEVYKKYEKYLSKTPLARGKEIEVKTYGGQEKHKDSFTHIFKMKSAREFTHGGFDNYDTDAELVAEYLWHGGKIRVNYPDWINKKVVDAIKSDVELYISKLLDSMIGLAFNNDLFGAYS